MRRSWLLAAAIPVLAITLMIPPALADDGLVGTKWPSGEDPGVPAYARIEPAPPHVINDGEWVAVVFYRLPACIPEGFNLLQFFDAPAAFGCHLTVEGRSLWNVPFVGSPFSVRSVGTGAVPVWFAPMESIDEATRDGALTISELAAADGLIEGTAWRFHELLKPEPLPPAFGGGGNPNPMLVISAHGELEDGRTFHLHVTEVAEELRTVRLVFR